MINNFSNIRVGVDKSFMWNSGMGTLPIWIRGMNYSYVLEVPSSGFFVVNNVTCTNRRDRISYCVIINNELLFDSDDFVITVPEQSIEPIKVDNKTKKKSMKNR